MGRMEGESERYIQKKRQRERRVRDEDGSFDHFLHKYAQKT